jgi:ribosome-binding factor A
MRSEIKDPRVFSFLSINRVEVAGDLSVAKVYVSSFMGMKKTRGGVAGLQSAAGYIRSVLGKKLKIRLFPALTFIFDTSIKDGMDMLQRMDELGATAQNAHDAATAPAATDLVATESRKTPKGEANNR